MKKEKITETYANLGFITVTPKRTEKGGARSTVSKSGKDMRGGKK